MFDGKRWIVDHQGVHVGALAKKTARGIYDEAAACDTEEMRKALAAWARDSEKRKHRDAMIYLARSEPGIAINFTALDADPWLLNVENGTVDLRTGKIRAHAPGDLLTKIAPVTYDPAATSPTFDRFLSEIMGGDAELVAFVLAFLGYCLTGDTREHVLCFWHGKGGNGKGVLGAVLLALLGDYAIKAAPDLLFRPEHTDRHPTELADLHGRRLAICNETTGGRAWDEGTVKDVTGGDRIRARRMKENFWEFDPTHKLVVWGNHKPTLRNVDDAMRRRLRLVPFAVSFVGRENKGLLAELLSEAPGILRRLVLACVQWGQHGLPDAAAVSASTESYLRDEDTLGQFFAAECIFDPLAKCTRKELRTRYVAWCEGRDEKPAGPKAIAQRLRDREPPVIDRNIRTAEGKTADGWAGVRLVQDAERQVPGDQGSLL